jgi:hypothetical protein
MPSRFVSLSVDAANNVLSFLKLKEISRVCQTHRLCLQWMRPENVGLWHAIAKSKINPYCDRTADSNFVPDHDFTLPMKVRRR